MSGLSAIIWRGFLKKAAITPGIRIPVAVNQNYKNRFSSVGSSDDKPSEGELRLTSKLKNRFPKATHIEVVDISGGCGSMYEVHVCSQDFQGLRTLAQHQLINEALKDEIKGMHGLRISTTATCSDES